VQLFLLPPLQTLQIVQLLLLLASVQIPSVIILVRILLLLLLWWRLLRQAQALVSGGDAVAAGQRGARSRRGGRVRGRALMLARRLHQVAQIGLLLLLLLLVALYPSLERISLLRHHSQLSLEKGEENVLRFNNETLSNRSRISSTNSIPHLQSVRR